MADVQGFLGHGGSSAPSGLSGFLNYAPPKVSAPATPPANLDKYQAYYKTLAPDERQNFLDSLLRGARYTGDASKLQLYQALKGQTEAPGSTSVQTAGAYSGRLSFLNKPEAALEGVYNLAKGATYGMVAPVGEGALQLTRAKGQNQAANSEIAAAGTQADKYIQAYRAGQISKPRLDALLADTTNTSQTAAAIHRAQIAAAPSGSDVAGSLGSLGLLAATGGGGLASKLGQAGFLGQMGSQTVLHAPEIGRQLFDPNVSTTDKVKLATESALGAALLVVGAKHGAEGVRDYANNFLDEKITTAQSGTLLTTLRQHQEAILAKTAVDTRSIAQGRLDATDRPVMNDISRPGATQTPITPENPSVAQSITPVAPQEGSTTLQSSVIPGAAEFAKHDVAPAVQGVVKTLKEGKDLVLPADASPEARLAADTVRKANSEINSSGVIESLKGREASKFFGKMSPEDGVANISSYERTGEFANAPKGYADTFKSSMDAAHTVLRQVYGDDLGYVENYVRRQFKFGSAADEAQGTAVLSDLQKTLSASKSPTRGRTLDMPLDEALQAMRERGIKVEPVTTNPELLRQWSVANAQRAQSFAETWQGLKTQGLISFTGSGDHPPEGMVPLNDRAAQVFFPSEAGMVQAGRYYASPEVARVLNNVISNGLESSPTIQGLRLISNQLNQLQLGLSGFHLTGTAINAGVSDIALGLRDIMRGQVVQAGQHTAKGFVPFYSFTEDIIKGDKLIQGLKNDSPEAYKLLEEKMHPAGARLGLDEKYRLRSYENMINAAKQGNYLGATLRLPSAFIQAVAHPLMNYAIPRVKIGAFLDLADSTLARLPEGASDAVRARELSKAWDSIDNRFGQIAYDNLFWNKTMKDTALMSTRSVGWNLGTVRELGGGVTDLFTQTARGKGITNRTLYTAALPIYVGTLGAVYQYLHTGKRPGELLDYFYPKNGLTDKNGNADRTTLPTYMKDVFAYGKSPFTTIAHKSSPLLSLVISLGSNRNYFGDMVRNPDDPKGTQLKQAGLYALSQLTPFSISQGQRSLKEGGPVQAAENLFGFTKAPGSITQTGFEQKTYDALTKQIGGGPRTPEQVQLATAKTQARDAAGKGNNNLVDQLMQSSQISPTTAKQLKADANMTSLQRAFRALDYVNQDRLLQSANADDIKKLGDLGDLRTRAQKASKNKNASAATRQAAARVANRLR